MNYYLLEQDLRIPNIATVGDVPENIEPLDWMRGQRLPAPGPGPLRLMLSSMSGEEPTDIIGSLLTLFSDDLKGALTQFGIDNIDYFPVELQHPLTHEVWRGYWLANIIGLVACLDVSRSVILPRPSGARGHLRSFYVDPDRAGDRRIFRLAEDPTLIILREDVRRHLQSLPLGGVRMRHTKSYGGP